MPPVSFVELGFSEEPSDSAVAENAPVVLHCAAFSTPHVGNPQIRYVSRSTINRRTVERNLKKQQGIYTSKLIGSSLRK